MLKDTQKRLNLIHVEAYAMRFKLEIEERDSLLNDRQFFFLLMKDSKIICQ